MDSYNLTIGLFIILLGFLVKIFPNLIAGYNTMSKDKKKNVDIKGLSTFMRNSLIIMGLLIITGNFVIIKMRVENFAEYITLIVILIGVTITLIKAQKFDHNRK